MAHFAMEDWTAYFMTLAITMDYNYFNRTLCREHILCSNLKLLHMNPIVLNWDLYYVEGLNNLSFCKIWIYGMAAVFKILFKIYSMTNSQYHNLNALLSKQPNKDTVWFHQRFK